MFTGLLVAEVRGTAAELMDGLPKWLDADRAFAVTMLQVRLIGVLGGGGSFGSSLSKIFFFWFRCK